MQNFKKQASVNSRGKVGMRTRMYHIGLHKANIQNMRWHEISVVHQDYSQTKKPQLLCKDYENENTKFKFINTACS